MTETSPCVTATSELDCLPGSSGSLLPGVKAKLMDSNGREVKELEKSGELLIQSPSVVLGYFNNEKATAETFVWHNDGRWIRTGDVALVRKSAQGHEHFLIVDRIKELIKVKVRRQKPPQNGAGPRLMPRQQHTGLPGGSRRARSSPALPRARLRLRRHPRAGLEGRRIAQGRRRQGRRRTPIVRHRGGSCATALRRGPQAAAQVAPRRHRLCRGGAAEPERQDPATPAAGPAEAATPSCRFQALTPKPPSTKLKNRCVARRQDVEVLPNQRGSGGGHRQRAVNTHSTRGRPSLPMKASLLGLPDARNQGLATGQGRMNRRRNGIKSSFLKERLRVKKNIVEEDEKKKQKDYYRG